MDKKTVGEKFACDFESILPGCLFLPVPKEIQVLLSDAMNELESNCIKDFENQRLYSIIGTAFFHKGGLVRWQLGREDLEDIGALLRLTGLLDLSAEGVREMVWYRQVYPPSCARGLLPPSTLPYSLPPHCTYFLLVVAQEYDMLAVLLESGGCTSRIEGKPGPNPIYVYDAQATLEHIHSLGIPKYISKWLDNLKKEVEGEGRRTPESNVPLSTMELTKSASSCSVKIIDPPPNLRHRSSVDFSSLPGWEEGVVGRSASLPNVYGAGPVMGRRAERERDNSSQSKDSDESEKDRQSLDTYSLFDLNDLDRSLHESSLSRVGMKMGGMLLHYVQLEVGEGVVVSSLGSGNASCHSAELSHVMNRFRVLSHHIQAVLSNTIAFRKLKGQDINSANVNKSLVAIKEHGIMFEGISDDKKSPATCYWATGRLFFTPQVREVYVCYQDGCPQNMVEVAFRIALNCYF